VASSDFPAGTKFFDVEDIPIADPPNGPALGFFTGKPVPVSEKTAMKLAYEREISPEAFDEALARAIASFAADE
jgi:hypothetical protein